MKVREIARSVAIQFNDRPRPIPDTELETLILGISAAIELERIAAAEEERQEILRIIGPYMRAHEPGFSALAEIARQIQARSTSDGAATQ